MDRFDEMRAKTIVGNEITGSTEYNVFTQITEPSKKDGVWLKSNETTRGVQFARNVTAETYFLDPDLFGQISVVKPYAQIIVEGTLYCFTTNPNESAKFDLGTNLKVGTLNIPSISFGSYGRSMDCVYYEGRIYVFYTVGTSSTSSYPIYYYIYNIETDTYENPINSGKTVKAQNGNYSCLNVTFYNNTAIILTGRYQGGSSSAGYLFTGYQVDLNTMEFTSINGSSNRAAVASLNCSRVNKRIYVFGYNSIIYYDLDTQQYKTLVTSEDFLWNLAYVYAVDDYIYLFGQSNTALTTYQRYNLSTNEIETLEANYPYVFNNTSNTYSKNRIQLEISTGILYLLGHTYSSDSNKDDEITCAMQLMDKTNYEEGVIVICLANDNERMVKLQDSTHLQIAVEDVFIAKNGKLDSANIVFLGDGTKWRLLKGTVAVTFDSGDSTSTVLVGYGGTLSEPSTMPSKDGYEFVYWTLNGSQYDFSTPVTEPITLEAKWIEISPTFAEYIESTGTQYIDTGYLTNANSEFVIDGFAIDGTLFGSGLQGKYMSAGILNIEDVYRARWRVSSSANVDVASTISCDTTRHSFKVNKTSFYIDDVLIGNLNSTYNFTETGTTYIFGWNNGSAVANIPSLARIYSFKIYDNGTLVRDFKPCKDTHGEYCLYDAVTNRYFYNQGTGSFRSSDWQPTIIEYIESTGTQYIDTGIKSTSNIRLETTVLGDYSSVCWYGARTTASNVYRGIYNYNGRFDWLGTSGSGLSYQTNPTVGEWHEISHGQKLVIDGSTLAEYNTTAFSTDFNIYLFAGNNGGSVVNHSSIKLKATKIYDGDTLVRDYVPALDNDVAGLYDKVSEIFFYNKGTGSFLAG